MSYLAYQNQLKYVTVKDVTTTGDSDALARDVARWDSESDPTVYAEWPTFECEGTRADFTASFDAGELCDYEASATWACSVDLSALDWSHPWEDSAIMAAETLYREHRNPTDPRWALPHITADALQYLRECAASFYGFTPMDADKLMRWYLYEAMPAEAEERGQDPVAGLLADAIEDARPITTGLPKLDAILGGGLHRGLTVVAGDPSSGKTMLGVWLALFAANQQEGTICYDMADMGGRRSALLRMISCSAAVAGVEDCELGRADLWGARERYEGRAAFDRVTKGRVVLLDKTDVAEVLSQLDYHAHVGRVSLAVLDFAQAMTYEGRALAFDPEAASQAVRALREWAHGHNAAVLLLSAYSKAASEAHARGAAPSMHDVLGSAELAYSAEHVLALTNPHDGKGAVIVRDLKARYAGSASQGDRVCTLRMDADHGRFF